METISGQPDGRSASSASKSTDKRRYFQRKMGRSKVNGVDVCGLILHGASQDVEELASASEKRRSISRPVSRGSRATLGSRPASRGAAWEAVGVGSNAATAVSADSPGLPPSQRDERLSPEDLIRSSRENRMRIQRPASRSSTPAHKLTKRCVRLATSFAQAQESTEFMKTEHGALIRSLVMITSV